MWGGVEAPIGNFVNINEQFTSVQNQIPKLYRNNVYIKGKTSQSSSLNYGIIFTFYNFKPLNITNLTDLREYLVKVYGYISTGFPAHVMPWSGSENMLQRIAISQNPTCIRVYKQTSPTATSSVDLTYFTQFETVNVLMN